MPLFVPNAFEIDSNLLRQVDYLLLSNHSMLTENFLNDRNSVMILLNRFHHHHHHYCYYCTDEFLLKMFLSVFAYSKIIRHSMMTPTVSSLLVHHPSPIHRKEQTYTSYLFRKTNVRTSSSSSNSSSDSRFPMGMNSSLRICLPCFLFCKRTDNDDVLN